ncbi:MAG: cytochrome c3 family protein [Rubrivivax sp.]|nr:cytochrome c3 family protein [Rubrivivax sp.]
MKRGIGKWVASMLAAGLGVFAAQVSAASITGSPHDFSGAGWGSNQVCIFCHAPHNANGGTPLWNHAATVATFTLYSSQTLTTLTMAQPGGVSKLCLSCHDGTVAMDSYATRTGTEKMLGDGMLGTNLSNDHPIGFTYNAALAAADGGLVTPASASLVVANVPLYDAKLECSSCHNVHDNALGGFLRKSNAASALCLSCHTK